MKKHVSLFLLALLFSPAALSSAKKELIVAAHYAPWYRGQVDGNWSFSLGNKTIRTAYKPTLGYYNNLDPYVLNKHITWATKYGINTFMIEWNGQDLPDFLSPLDISMQTFIQNPNFENIDFFFVYSLISALRFPNEPAFTPVDLNRSRVINKMLADFRYACRYYMKRSNYLRIKNRPVVYLWAVPLAQGNLKKALNKLRNVIKAETGKDPYLIADVVAMYTDPVPSMTEHFDAVMPYVMLEVEGKPPKNYSLKDSSDEVLARYRYFHYALQDLGCNFVPAVFPGFDAVGAPWCYDGKKRLTTPRVDRAKPWFKNLVRDAQAFVDPDVNMLYITSWSEWNEGTNIEPSKQFKFKYLDSLRQGLNQSPTDPPARNRIRFKFTRVVDPVGGDSRLLGASFQRLEFLDPDLSPLLTLDIGTDEARKAMGWGWYQNEYEHSDGSTFCWAGKKQKFATLYVNVPQAAKFLKVVLRAVDNQKVILHIDDRWITELPTYIPYRWTQHLISLY
jgi:hypothetical protein